jgi:drug/metabolite transporter (DMT)-like permease
MLPGILAGLAAGALWGLVFVVPRMAPGLSAVDIAGGRFVSYGVVSALAMLFVLRARRLPTFDQAIAAIVLSLLGFTGYYLLLTLAIQDSGTEVPTLIIGVIPIWMMLLGKPSGLRWATLVPGLLLTAAGLVLMMAANTGAFAPAGGPPHPDHPDHPDYWRGIAYALAAMVSWTLFGLMNSAWLKRHPDVNATDWANWLGVATGVGALALWLAAGSESKVLLAHKDRAWIAIVMIASGIGSAWLATILWNVASQRLSASLCGQLIIAETVFALVYSYAWDAQWPTALQLTACGLFVLGIGASIRAHR